MSTTRRIGGTFAAILALTLGGLLVTAGPAGAAESEGECFIHAVHEAEEQGLEGDELNEVVEEEVLACTQAPSPILPETNEIIWGSIAFALLFLAFLKWGLPAVRNMMATREERIRSDLERAEQAKVEAEQVLEQYRAQLAEARAEASRILEEARQAADQMRRDLIARAETEATELRNRAQQDVELATQRAMADLQRRVAELSIELAERIVERSLDRDTQLQLIENYINEVGTNR
jgi:F-type H+-transporting ATPase subunit b